MVLKYEYETLVTVFAHNQFHALPPSASTIVNSLLKKVLRPGYARAPKFPKGKRFGKHHTRERSFEPSYAPKPKVEKDTGKELQDDLRKLFNKLTGSKYEDLMPKLINHIEIMKKYPKFTVESVMTVLFTVIENTPFYSRMYGKCYATLARDNDFLRTAVAVKRAQFLESLSSIESANPNTDYDKFCEVNKVNNKRQAMAKFLVALAEEKLEAPSTVVDILNAILRKFKDKIEIEDSKDIVDALANLIGCMIIDSEFARELLRDTEVHNGIRAISKMKARSKESLTNKAVFKFMDINDVLATSK